MYQVQQQQQQQQQVAHLHQQQISDKSTLAPQHPPKSNQQHQPLQYQHQHHPHHINQNTHNFQQPAGMMDDPVYLFDEHVLNRMLSSELRQQQSLTFYEPKFQRDFTDKDRRELATWMYDVCIAEECQPDILPLSIFIVDRFLSFVKTKRTQLQLLGSVALLLASKLRQTSQIPAKHLIYYTQDLISLQELKTWELFVLTTLKWDLTYVTPIDFLDILMKRLKLPDDIEEHAVKLIVQCCIDFKHSDYPPSMIAWACLMRAMEFR